MDYHPQVALGSILAFCGGSWGLLFLILHVQQSPGNDLHHLGGSLERFRLHARLRGDVLIVWETPERGFGWESPGDHVGFLGGYWQTS